jgi:hypothetical protein
VKELITELQNWVDADNQQQSEDAAVSIGDAATAFEGLPEKADKGLALDCFDISRDKLFVAGCKNKVEFEVEMDGDGGMVAMSAENVQRIYNYLGEWLVKRQTTGLGDK